MDDGTRTRDGRNHNPGLYQLSYTHHYLFKCHPKMARPAGLEPATPGLEGRCSIRLSYGRIIPGILALFRAEGGCPKGFAYLPV